MTERRPQAAPRLSRSGGRRRRMFTPGELEVLLLHLLQRGPRHGYDLMGEIEQSSGSGYVPSPGVIYPALQKLEQASAIALVSPPSSRQRVFALTRAGEARLEVSEAAVKRVLKGLEAAQPTPTEARGDLIRAALARLQAALHEHGAGLPQPLEAQIAAQLDDLALLMRRRTPPTPSINKETS